MKSKLLLLLVFYSLTIGAGIARAVDIQTAPVDRNSTSSLAGDKQSVSIGPRDPEKEKPRGVGVNVFVNKNVSVNSSVAVLSPEPYVQPGQIGNDRGFGLSTSQIGGTVGLKVFFN